MIDTEKLLGRINDKGVILSEKSISNLGVVRRRLVDIDGMLKDKLVLAKVREGIRRQEEERLRRVEREDDIEEKDDDRDVDMDGRKRKPKKPKPSGSRGILGPAGALLTGAGFAVVAQNLGFFRVATQVLKGVGTVALATFMGLATVVDTGYKIVSAVEAKTLQMFGERGLKTLKTFQKVFTTFVNVAVISAISAAGMRAFGFTRGKLFPKVKIKKPRIRIKRPIKLTDTVKPPTKMPVDITDLRKSSEKIVKRAKVTRSKRGSKITRGQEKVTYSDAMDQNVIRKGKKIKKTKSTSKSTSKEKVKVTADKIKKEAQKEAGGGQGSGKPTGKPKPSKVKTGSGAPEKIPLTEQQKIVNAAFSNDPYQRLARIAALERELGMKFTAKQVADLKKMSPQNFLKFYSDYYDISEGFGPPEAPFTKPKPKPRSNQDIFDDMFKNIRTGEGGMGIEDPFGKNFFEDPSGGPGAMKLRRGIISNTDKITNVKSLSTLLEAFGGTPLIKATRQFLGNTVGRIPLIGDLIGLALDYFVFKEPIQRALFMAAGGALGGSIGAWLGGILGTAVPVVGNLAGAVVGGFLGGVGGDMLGGFLYDVLFAGKPGFPAGESQTPLEKGAKGAVKLGLSGGGLVPALLSMNNGGSVPDIAYSASYDKPGAGSVRFIPIFVPSEERDVESANVSGVVITKRKRSQSSLYAGGLIS